MVPAGGASTWKPGDIAALPPGWVHQTPARTGAAQRAVLFFTLAMPDVDAQLLYDPTHQILPLDVITKVVTHNFFASHLSDHMDLLLQYCLQWCSHPKFTEAMITTRMAPYAPECNKVEARKLQEAVIMILRQRNKAQDSDWKETSIW